MGSAVLERRSAGDPLAVLGSWSLIVNAPLQLALGFPLASLQASTPIPVPILALNAVSHVLLVAGVVGLWRSGATGESRWGRFGILTTIIGLGVLILAEIVAVNDLEAATPFYSAATVTIAIGMLLAGITTIVAKCWQGWRQFAPLACGLYVPLVMIPAFSLPGYAANYAIGLWVVCWLLVGLALRTDVQSAGQQRVPALE